MESGCESADYHQLMAATPKRRRMRAALSRRAEAEIGPGALALDYVVAWVARGGLIADLATSLADELGESVSRQILSLVVHRLAPDATARIVVARRGSTGVPSQEAAILAQA